LKFAILFDYFKVLSPRDNPLANCLCNDTLTSFYETPEAGFKTALAIWLT